MSALGSLDDQSAAALSVRSGQVFTPRTPVADRDFFAGRWEQLTSVTDSVSQSGLHVVIYRERGVGKTSLANIIAPLIHVLDERTGGEGTPERIVVKVNSHSSDDFSSAWSRLFDEVTFTDGTKRVGFNEPVQERSKTLREALDLPPILTIDDVRRALATLPGSVFVIDEFDRIAETEATAITDLVKALCDYAVPTTIVLVGVSSTVDALVRDHRSIGRALVQIPVPRMRTEELLEILKKAETALGMEFTPDAASLIVHMSQGLPHYTHLLGLHAVREALVELRRTVNDRDVYRACDTAVKQAHQSVTERHNTAVHSAHREALYAPILVACAVAASNTPDPLGYFNPASVSKPLSAILERRVEIATFNRHLGEWTEERRGAILERIGQQHSYRYRFGDPLMVPHVLMDAVNRGLATNVRIKQLVGTR